MLAGRALACVNRHRVRVIPMTLRVEIPRNFLAIREPQDRLVLVDRNDGRLVAILDELVAAGEADDVTRGEIPRFRELHLHPVVLLRFPFH